MKLNLLFIAIDILTLLAYPIVFLHSKRYQLSKSSGNATPANVLLNGSGILGG